MIFAVVGIAWMVLALAVGSLLGRTVTVADRSERAVHRVPADDQPLYVADILRAHHTAA